MKILPFTLSLFFLGSVFYLSEFFFLIAVVLNFKTFKITLNNPLRIIGFIIFNLLNVLSFYFNQDIQMALFGLLFSFIFLFRLSLKIDIKHLHIVYKLLNFHLYYAFFLYFLTLIFGIEISQLFEFGFYGEERSESGIGIMPYFVGSIALPRLYGLFSEPSLFGSINILLVYWLSQINNYKLKRGFILRLTFAVILSQSIFSILLLLIFLYSFYKKNKITKFEIRAFSGAILILLFIVINYASVRYAIFFRYIDRFFEIFQNLDRSGFIRLNATWGTLSSFFELNFYEYILGLSRDKVNYFLESQYFIQYGDFNNINFVAGQRGSVILLSILHFGLFGSIIFLISFYQKDLVFTIIIYLILFFTTYFLTFGILSLLVISKTKIKNE